MLDTLIALIVDESKWYTVSIGVSLVALLFLFVRHRPATYPTRRWVMAAMNLYFGLMVGTMAFGHLLAVTTKLLGGTLEGSLPLFYLIGIVLAAPSWWMIYHTRQILAATDNHERRTVLLNTWLVLTLLVLGLPNLPLAVPGILNIGYRFHTRPWMGWLLVAIAVVVSIGLFIGSLIFWASGQSFEQFQGIE